MAVQTGVAMELQSTVFDHSKGTTLLLYIQNSHKMKVIGDDLPECAFLDKHTAHPSWWSIWEPDLEYREPSSASLTILPPYLSVYEYCHGVSM